MTWPLGLSTGIAYRHPLLDVLEPIARAGFRALEISTAPHHFDFCDAALVEQVRARLSSLGLRAHSLHAPFGHDVNLTSPEPDVRARSLERLLRSADALQALGGTLFVIHPGGEDQRWVWDRAARLDLSVQGLTHVWEGCRARGLSLVIETPLPHLLGGQPEDFAFILKRIPPEGTGVCVDTSHTSLGGFLLPCLQRFGDRLVHIQASDNHGVHDDHLPPGHGRIDWPPVLAELTRLGYRGVFMLEVAGDGDIVQHAASAHAAAVRLFDLSRTGP
jgi:sugar phosphate isomerase/epimerase